MASFSRRTLLHEWLVEAGLDELPFVREVEGELAIDYARDADVHPRHTRTPTRWKESPEWVHAIWDTMVEVEGIVSADVLAERSAQRARKQRVPPVLPHERKVAWRRFMLLVSADPVMRRAIESTLAIGDVQAAVSYIRPLFAEFVRKVTVEAPVSAALAARQARRARRLDGRAVRPPDAAYVAEARFRAPKPKSPPES